MCCPAGGPRFGGAVVLTGDADPYAPQDQVEALDRELRSAAVRYKIVTYPGVKHSFTDPAATEDGKKDCVFRNEDVGLIA
jgi:dienelactone hydrolase